jgi:hypothetical protein
MSPFAHLLTVVTLLAIAAAHPVSAQPLEERDNRAAACRRAVEGLMTALETGDADALRLLIYTDRRTVAQQVGLTVLIDCVVAQRTLEQAMTRRWGAAGATAGQTFFTPADRAALQSARVESDGDNSAQMVLSASVSPITLHRNRFDGRWRVKLAALTSLSDGFDHSPGTESAKRIGYMRAVAGALQRTATAVEQGKLPSPEAARAALQKTLETALKSAPTEPPAGAR